MPALQVIANDGENIENLLRRFKKKLKYEGRFLEMRKKDFYIKKSERLRKRRRRKKLSDGTSIKEDQ